MEQKLAFLLTRWTPLVGDRVLHKPTGALGTVRLWEPDNDDIWEPCARYVEWDKPNPGVSVWGIGCKSVLHEYEPDWSDIPAPSNELFVCNRCYGDGYYERETYAGPESCQCDFCDGTGVVDSSGVEELDKHEWINEKNPLRKAII